MKNIKMIMRDTIDSEGIEYFTSNLGMSREDAIDYYFDFDKEGAVQSLADDQDRGDNFSIVMMVLKRNKSMMVRIITSFSRDNTPFGKTIC